MTRPRLTLLAVALVPLVALAVGRWMLADGATRGPETVAVDGAHATPLSTAPRKSELVPALPAASAPAPLPETRTAAPTEAKSPASEAGSSAASIRVRVVDQAGRPLAGLPVYWSDASREDEAPVGPRLRLGYRWKRAAGVTNDAGLLRVTGLEPGSWRIAAGALPTWAYHFADAVELSAERGAEALVHVAPTPPQRLIAGTVFQPDGEPVRRAFIEYGWTDSIGAHRRIYTWTSVGGTFVLLPPADARSGMLRAEVYRGKLRSATLAPVDAGSVGHELHLGPPRHLELIVLGAGGAPVEDFRATCSYQLGQQWVRDESGPQRVSGEPLLWDLPTVPARIQVYSSSHEPFDSGVLAPEELGDVFTIRLVAHPVVEGRVLFGGEPVPGADVTIEHLAGEAAARGASVVNSDPAASYLAASDPGTVDFSDWLAATLAATPSVRVRSDEDGRFSTSVAVAGWYRAVGWNMFRGRGESAPFEVTDEGASAIELELDDPPATLRGHVLLPLDHGPEEVWLLVSSGFGYRGLHADGSYELPGLKPGPCRISIVAAYGGEFGAGIAGAGEAAGNSWFSMSHGPSDPPTWLERAGTVRLDLAPGELRELDIDLASRPQCWLEGRLDLGEPIAERSKRRYGFESRRVSLIDMERESTVARCDIDAQGRFALGVDEPGFYRLEVDLQTHVSDRVSLVSGTSHWEAALEFGSLSVLPVEQASEGGAVELVNPTTHMEWIGPGDLRAIVRNPTWDAATATRRFERVPAGRVVVRRGNGTRWDAEPDAPLGEVTVEVGREASFRFPGASEDATGGGD